MLLFRRVLFSIFLTISLAGTGPWAQEARWFKGQTHAHSTNSDGDVFPRQAVRWYQDHEYRFLVVTDHNVITDVRTLDADGNRDDFILIPGEEVTDRKYLHVNGINLKSPVTPQRAESTLVTLTSNIDAIRQAGGIAQINHPNWKRTLTCDIIAALEQASLLEVYNMDQSCNNHTAGGSPGMEDIWDCVLSKGVRLYGVASDDAHDYEGEFRADRSFPGRGWVMVRAKELTPDAITAALAGGDFYATGGLGITLKDIRITNTEYRLQIEPESDFTYTTRFIGKNGEVLKEEFGLEPVYVFNGKELYVRAKIICSTGDFAITQPVFLGNDR
jgi:predicted metal-dependent phosphoesterase TrpH